MKKIILDTNFLLIPFQFNVDIFEELDKLIADKLELCIVDKTFYELQNIMQKNEASFKDRSAAKMADKLIRSKIDSGKVVVLKTEKNLNVDQLILNLLKQGEFIVATQDKALKQKISLLKARLVVLRQKRYLELV